MIDIPLDAKVICTDGECGRSVTVVIDPTVPRVTHFVVQVKGLDPEERLVPIDYVARTSVDRVWLKCPKEDLVETEPFVEIRFVSDNWAEAGYMYSGSDVYMMPYAVPIEPLYEVEERVPEGAQAIYRGTLVEATDGYVGRVGELVVDPKSGNITHFVLEKGHLWGKKEITLPLSAIDRTEPDSVYLTLSKSEIAELPAIPLKRKYSRSGEATVELVAMLYDDPDKASKDLKFVQELAQRKVVRLLDSAILVKDEEGQATLKEGKDLDAGQGRLLGAITGGLVGLLAGPVGAVVGAIAGAGAGAFAAKHIDMGISDEFLRGLGERLEPGSAALLILVQHEWAAPLSRELAGRDGILMQETLTDDLIEKLTAASEAETGSAGEA